MQSFYTIIRKKKSFTKQFHFWTEGSQAKLNDSAG